VVDNKFFTADNDEGVVSTIGNGLETSAGGVARTIEMDGHNSCITTEDFATADVLHFSPPLSLPLNLSSQTSLVRPV
jgi:hypothetical protein